jgi:hypothetical protein
MLLLKHWRSGIRWQSHEIQRLRQQRHQTRIHLTGNLAGVWVSYSVTKLGRALALQPVTQKAPGFASAGSFSLIASVPRLTCLSFSVGGGGASSEDVLLSEMGETYFCSKIACGAVAMQSFCWLSLNMF